MCLIDGSHDLFGDFLHLFSLGVQSLWPVNRFVFANLQVCADRLGPAPNTVTVGIMKVNKGPFIQMNRLITHCYRVLATPQPDRYSQQTVLPFFPRWSFWAQSMKRQYLIGRKEDTKENVQRQRNKVSMSNSGTLAFTNVHLQHECCLYLNDLYNWSFCAQQTFGTLQSLDTAEMSAYASQPQHRNQALPECGS